MKERVLQNKLMLMPEVIEDGLILVKNEPYISKNRRMDILFRDSDNYPVYVEVKYTVSKKDIEQVKEQIGLIGPSNARFRLIASEKINDKFVKELEELKGTDGLDFDWKVINHKELNIQELNLEQIVEIPSRKNSFYSKLKKEHDQIAQEIIGWVANLHTPDNPMLGLVSDGYMFHLVERSKKFLSITPVEEGRLLFHFPNGGRNYVYDKFCNSLPIYKPDEKTSGKNQLDISLSNIKDVNTVAPIILCAYNASLNQVHAIELDY